MATTRFRLSRRNVLKAAAAAAVAATAGKQASAEWSPKPTDVAQLFYTDVGRGKNLLLIHGWACDSHDWSGQLPVLEEKYRVVALDLRGHGRSEVAPSGQYSPAHFLADIENLLDGRFKGETFVAIGHSMGGQIAARLSAKRPDLVSAVVSIDGALGWAGDSGAFFRKLVDDMNAGDPAVVVPPVLQALYDPSTDPALKRWHARRAQGTPAHVVREAFPPLFFGVDQVGFGEQSADFCRRLAVPIYHLCRDRAQARRMAPWFSHPKSKVEVWDRTGHWIAQDRRDDVNAALVSWIESL
ncbi:alpha/beta fold hydrolase [Bordetella genomosp. 13]|uniref:alpha/beta fold hydrolase n=1 Tax=Bordetella genomosp. 13 TaxID=463040 RepID=UPI0011A75C3C|nr:alpha/beta hydrolase [Bordetella genomosp. 13]